MARACSLWRPRGANAARCRIKKRAPPRRFWPGWHGGGSPGGKKPREHLPPGSPRSGSGWATARRRLKPNSRQCLRRKPAPQMPHGSLDRAQAGYHAQLRRQLLTHHVGVARWRRSRSAIHSVCSARRAGRVGNRHSVQPPAVTYRCTVSRLQPSSAAIRRVPQPKLCSRNIAATSSGVLIVCLRPSMPCGKTPIDPSSCLSLLRKVAGFLMSPPDGVTLSPSHWDPLVAHASHRWLPAWYQSLISTPSRKRRMLSIVESRLWLGP